MPASRPPAVCGSISNAAKAGSESASSGASAARAAALPPCSELVRPPAEQVQRAVERRDRPPDRAAPPCRRRSASRSDVRAIRTRSRRCRRSRRTTTRHDDAAAGGLPHRRDRRRDSSGAGARPRISAARITPVPSGLVSISRSPGRSPPLRSSCAGPGPPGHREAERQFGALGAVAADQHRAGFLQAPRCRPSACGTDPARRSPGAPAARSRSPARSPAFRPSRRCRRAHGWRRCARTDTGRRPSRGRNRRSAAAAARPETTRAPRRPGCRDRSRRLPASTPGASRAIARASTSAGTFAAQPPQRIALSPAASSASVIAGSSVYSPHPAPVDPVLEQPQAASIGRERAARGDGPPVAGADQRQRALLRHGAAQPAPGERAPQIVGERRSGAHRVDAGLLARMRWHRRDIAGGEHRSVRRRAQALLDQHEARVRRAAGRYRQARARRSPR